MRANATLTYNDEILIAIAQLQQQGVENFTSDSDKAYRNEAVRLMFCGLNRRNQDKLISFLLRMLKTQDSNQNEKLNDLDKAM